MAFSDPISVTIDSVASNYNLIERSGTRAVYRTADGAMEVVISHQEGKRNRRTVRFNRYDVTADPFVPSNNVEVSYSAYIVIDTPIAGFADADVVLDVLGVMAFLDSTNLTKVMTGQS